MYTVSALQNKAKAKQQLCIDFLSLLEIIFDVYYWYYFITLHNYECVSEPLQNWLGTSDGM